MTNDPASPDDEIITVTIAPGERYRLPKHPSGLQGLPPCYIDAGETTQMTRGEALRLYEFGTVLHPDTGTVKPPYVAPPRPVNGWTLIRGETEAEAMAKYEARLAAEQAAQRAGGKAPARLVDYAPGDPNRRMVTQYGTEDPLGPLPGLSASEGGWA